MGIPEGRERKRNHAFAPRRTYPEKGFDDALDAAERAGVPFLMAGTVLLYSSREAGFRGSSLPRLGWRR